MLKVLKSSLNTQTHTSDINQSVNNSDNMLTNGSNQYIQPDYLSPLPITLDSKRSPLALLAQTCSQIGADATCSTTTATTSSSVTKSVDKPLKKSTSDYEKTANRKTPPQSKPHHDVMYNRQEAKEMESKSGFKSPTIKSASPAINSTQQQDNNGNKFIAEQRIALDMAMQQQQNQLSKDIQQSFQLANYRPSAVYPSALSSLGHHPHPLSAYHHAGLAGLDAATAAALGAFRHPAYSNVAHHLAYAHHVPVSLGLGLASYQQAFSAVSYGQRLQQQQQQQQQHANNNKNGETSICRDPYCTGCPNNSPAPAVSSSSPNNSPTTTTTAVTNSCPAGCTQCDHVTRTTSAAAAAATAALMNTTATLSSSTVSMSTPIVTSAPDTTTLALLRPYVCNWIAGDHYCGKRFTSSEELLQHLRTHTSLSSAPSVEPSSNSPTYSHLNASLHPHSAHLLAASALHRTYPTPPLSPLSMARYHPYSAASKHLNSSTALQHSAAPATAAAATPSPLMSLHHPYGLAGYYSTHPYSLYSQRMLAGSGVLP